MLQLEERPAATRRDTDGELSALIVRLCDANLGDSDESPDAVLNEMAALLARRSHTATVPPQGPGALLGVPENKEGRHGP